LFARLGEVGKRMAVEMYTTYGKYVFLLKVQMRPSIKKKLAETVTVPISVRCIANHCDRQ
jgi:hypothetical protein